KPVPQARLYPNSIFLICDGNHGSAALVPRYARLRSQPVHYASCGSMCRRGDPTAQGRSRSAVLAYPKASSLPEGSSGSSFLCAISLRSTESPVNAEILDAYAAACGWVLARTMRSPSSLLDLYTRPYFAAFVYVSRVSTPWRCSPPRDRSDRRRCRAD